MKISVKMFVVFLLLNILSGCLPFQTFTKETVAGVWVESDSRNLQFPEGQSPCFEFKEDGTFWAYHYPEEIFIKGGKSTSEPINGHGEWYFEEEGAFLGNKLIHLEFNPNHGSNYPDGFDTSLEATSIRIEKVYRLFTDVENDKILFLIRDLQQNTCLEE